MQTNEIAFYVPTEFDSSTVPKSQRDYAYYFLNLLHWKWICWQSDSRGYARLKHDYLTRIIPKSIWPDLRDSLWGDGVIQRDNVYDEGRKCYGYRLHPNYRQARRVVCNNAVLCKRIERVLST